MDSLPNEIILEILHYLSIDHRKSPGYSLWDLALVNRRFHSLAVVGLYESYSCSLGHPPSFLRTIARAPNLATCVKHIDWNPDDKAAATLFDYQSIATAAAIATRPSATAMTFRSFFAQPFFDVEAERIALTDLFLCVILFFTTNIETISISGVRQWTDYTYWLKPIALDRNHFTKLRELSVDGPLRLQNVSPLFTIPSIRTVRLSRITVHRDRVKRGVIKDWEEDDVFARKLQEDGCYVENLHVHECDQGTADVLSLVGLFHNLQTFDFDFYESTLNRGTNITRAITDIFTQHRDTLKTLRLHPSGFMDTSVFKPLQQSAALRSLDISLWSLIPTFTDSPSAAATLLQGLPADLEQLTLSPTDLVDHMFGSFASFYDILLAIVPTIKQHFHALESLEVVGGDPLTESVPCQIQLHALHVAFNQVGIKFASLPGVIAPLDELHALDYVESEWVWVQPIDTYLGKWTYKIDTIEHCTSVYVSDELKDDWVYVSIEIGRRLLGQRAEDEMNEYTVEQPIWYWEELQEKKRQLG